MKHVGLILELQLGPLVGDLVEAGLICGLSDRPWHSILRKLVGMILGLQLGPPVGDLVATCLICCFRLGHGIVLLH